MLHTEPICADIAAPGFAAGPALQRARGEARIAFKRRGGLTVLDDLFQSGCLKLRLPARADRRMAEAVLLNTAGGLTDGDDIRADARWGEGACAIVTTQAAERVYRSRGGPAHMRATLSAGEGACAFWLPQETILFDGGRLVRANRATLAPDAQLLACEAVVFGRAAMGERVASGQISDGWEIRKGGRLIFADRLRLDGAIGALLSRPALGNGACAAASLVYAGINAARVRDALRAMAPDDDCIWACSTMGEVTLARFVAAGGQGLRASLAAAIAAAQGAMTVPEGAKAGLPRAWML